MIAVIVIAVIVFGAGAIVGIYNSLVKGRNRVRTQWSQIDVQLKRRCDLIPNLMKVVQGYAGHEKGIMNAVTEAHRTMLSAKTQQEEMRAADGLSAAVGRLLALAENYPDLKANENYSRLMNELSETENKISIARQFYNDSVYQYNNSVQVFPAVLFANMFGFKEETLYQVTEADKILPDVSL